MVYIPGFLKFSSSRNLTSGRNNCERNEQLEGYSARQCDFEDLQWCADSRWLTNGSDHNRNYNFSMWPDNDLPILLFPCSNLFTESFVTCLRNKAHVYTFSYLKQIIQRSRRMSITYSPSVWSSLNRANKLHHIHGVVGHRAILIKLSDAQLGKIHLG